MTEYSVCTAKFEYNCKSLWNMSSCRIPKSNTIIHYIGTYIYYIIVCNIIVSSDSSASFVAFARITATIRHRWCGGTHNTRLPQQCKLINYTIAYNYTHFNGSNYNYFINSFHIVLS